MFKPVADPRPAFREPGEYGFTVLLGDAEVHATPIRLARQYTADGLRSAALPAAALSEVTPDMVTVAVLDDADQEDGEPRRSVCFVRLLSDAETQHALTPAQLARIARGAPPEALEIRWGGHNYNLAAPTAVAPEAPPDRKAKRRRRGSGRREETASCLLSREAWLAAVASEANARGLAAAAVLAEADAGQRWLALAALRAQTAPSARVEAHAEWAAEMRDAARRHDAALALVGAGENVFAAGVHAFLS